MNKFTWIMSLAVLLRFGFCFLNASCSDKLQKIKSLKVIDKLLNQTQINIANGVRLRRRNNLKLNSEEIYICHNDSSMRWLTEINGRLERMLETHVLEFDMASILNRGKLHDKTFLLS